MTLAEAGDWDDGQLGLLEAWLEARYVAQARYVDLIGPLVPQVEAPDVSAASDLEAAAQHHLGLGLPLDGRRPGRPSRTDPQLLPIALTIAYRVDVCGWRRCALDENAGETLIPPRVMADPRGSDWTAATLLRTYLGSSTSVVTAKEAPGLGGASVHKVWHAARNKTLEQWLADGRRVAGRLGAWPWALAPGGRLAARWWRDPTYEERLVQWSKSHPN